ncbi:MAG: hypothetical protein KGO48_13520 [Alphaproteobacteria bacterium]|nr:hypothetical protein [Alphaproteobacteria bacterium]
MANAWVPRTFSDAEVLAAVDFVKSRRSDIWNRMVEHERLDEGYKDIARELLDLLNAHRPELVLADKTRLRFQMRRIARLEAGKPV